MQLRVVPLFLIFSILLAASVAAAPPPEGTPGLPSAKVEVTPNGLAFTVWPGFERATLRVRERGAGMVVERTLVASSDLSYHLVDQQGKQLADGKYVFELVFSGDPPGVRSDPAAEASTSGRLSGAFEIHGTTVVLQPSLAGRGATEGLEMDVKQQIVDVPILGDAIVEGALCVSDSTDCVFDAILFEVESFDTPGFGAADIKVKDNVPEIWFADTSSGDTDFALTAEDSRLFLRDLDAETLPFTLEAGAPSDVLYLTQSGSVGVGTAVPAKTLHVLGDARIDGDVTLGSSRTLKTAFEPVLAAEILAKVADLPVAAWRYKREDETARHIGPFAEDFQRLFGLGDGEAISIVDAQGVAFLAIQGLQEQLAARESEFEQRLAEKEGALEELRAEKDGQIAELIERFEQLERRVRAGSPSWARPSWERSD